LIRIEGKVGEDQLLRWIDSPWEAPRPESVQETLRKLAVDSEAPVEVEGSLAGALTIAGNGDVRIVDARALLERRYGLDSSLKVRQNGETIQFDLKTLIQGDGDTLQFSPQEWALLPLDARTGSAIQKASQAILLRTAGGTKLSDLSLTAFSGDALAAADQLAPDRRPLFGQLAFHLDDITPGSLQRVELDLPEGGVHNPVLIKQTAETTWEPFDYDPITGTGVVFHDDDGDGRADRAVLWIRDGGRGDRDGLANGQIVDPAVLAGTALTLQNVVNTLPETTSTTSRIKLADIVIADDTLGSNVISLIGPDAAFFELVGSGLFLKSGTKLNFEAKSRYAVTVMASDPTIEGLSPLTTPFTLHLADVHVDSEQTLGINKTDTGSPVSISPENAASDSDVIANLQGSPDWVDIQTPVTAILNATSAQSWGPRFAALNTGSPNNPGTGERVSLKGVGKYSFVATSTPEATTSIALEPNKNTAFFLHDAYSAFYSGLALTPDSLTGESSTARLLNIDTITMGSAGGTSIVDLTSTDYLTGSATVHGASRGRSIFWGSDENDVFISGGGDAVIYGGAGLNRHHLADGREILQYRSGAGANDLITNFNPDRDKLQLWHSSTETVTAPAFSYTPTSTVVSWAGNIVTFEGLNDLNADHLRWTHESVLIG